MRKYQVTFWTNVIFGEGEQQSFKKVYETDEETLIKNKVVRDLNDHSWLPSSLKANHYFKTSTVTDFEIKELEE